MCYLRPNNSQNFPRRYTKSNIRAAQQLASSDYESVVGRTMILLRSNIISREVWEEEPSRRSIRGYYRTEHSGLMALQGIYENSLSDWSHSSDTQLWWGGILSRPREPRWGKTGLYFRGSLYPTALRPPRTIMGHVKGRRRDLRTLIEEQLMVFKTATAWLFRRLYPTVYVAIRHSYQSPGRIREETL